MKQFWIVALLVVLNASSHAANGGGTSLNPSQAGDILISSTIVHCNNYDYTVNCYCSLSTGLTYCSNTNSLFGGAAPSFNTSVTDNLSFNHIHYAWDLKGADSSGGCSTCGSVAKQSDFVPTLALQRFHRFRDISEQGSFGPGIFNNFDVSLSLMRNGAANRIRVFDASYAYPMLLDDGLNFRGNGDVMDGVYVDSLSNLIKDLRLTDALGGAGNLVTDLNQGKSAVITTKDGRHYFFEVINLGSRLGTPIPGASPWQHVDVGAVAAEGNSVYGQTEDFDILGSGGDIWNNADGFRFMSKTVSGDFNIVARIASVSNSDTWAKAGVMLRQSTDADSIHAMAVATSGQGYAFQRRTTTGGSSDHTGGGGTNYPNSWVRLNRQGNIVIAYRAGSATDSAQWVQIGTIQLATTDPVQVGLCVTAHNDGALCTAQFRNVVLEAANQSANWTSTDIGTSTSGTTTSLGTQNTFTLRSSGKDIWDQNDEGQFAYQALRGNGSLTARVTSLSRTDGWAKAGVIFRESLADNSKYAYSLLSSDNGTAFQRRTSTGGSASHTGGPGGSTPQWVRLTRTGNTITSDVSTDGAAWTNVGSDTITMGNDIYVGLMSTAHHDGTLSTSTFDNVTLAGTPTPVNEWPATQLDNTLGGRLSRIEDRNGYGIDLTYKYNPAGHPNTSTQQQTDIAAAPDRQWQINTVTDAHSRALTFTYNGSQVSGRWVVSQIGLPNGNNVQYTYANGQLSQVAHPDGTTSTFSATFDPNTLCTVVHYNDAGADGMHRRKDAYLTNNFNKFMDGFIDDAPSVWNSASLLVRMVVNGSNEVSYLNAFDQNNPFHWVVYEGQGRVKEIANGRQVRFYKDGWTVNPGQGLNSFNGAEEDTYLVENSLGDGDNYYLGYLRRRPATVTDEHGVTKSYEYDGTDAITKTTLSDGTTEEQSFNQFRQPTRYKDRLNRVTKFSYDARGNMLTKEVGILFTGGQDVNQAEYAINNWEYYPAGDTNQFLLKTEFDADYDNNNSDMHRTDYVYNAQHFLVTKTEGADVHSGPRAQWTFTYDSAGRMATSADAIGRTTTYGYDSRDRVEKLTYSDGSTERFIYGTGADANMLVKQKDRNGNVAKFEYDNSGRRIKTITAYSKMDLSDNETLISDTLVRVEEICSYLDGTNLKKTCLRSGDLTEYTFDYRQRLKSTTLHPRNNVSLTSTNTFVNNLLFSVEDPYGRKSYNNYRSSDSAKIRSVRGTMPTFSLADSAAIGALNRDLTTNAAYIINDLELDAAQQTVARVDGRNIRHTRSYDSRGRLTQSIEAESVGGNATTVQAKTQFEYDANSNRTRVKNPRTFTENSNFYTEFTYTGRNLLASQTEAAGKPESATMSYTYFLDKRLADTTDGRGFVWSQTYKECCGRLATKADPILQDGKQPVTYFGYDYFGNTTHTARLKDVAGVPDCCTGNLDTAQILNETTTKFDARNRPIAQTVWLDPIGQVDENDPPIFGDAGAPAGKTGLTTRWRYDDNLSDNVGIDADYAAQLTGLNLGANNDGRAVEVTNPAGEKSVMVSDGAGRSICTIDGNLNKVTTSYDAIVNNLVETIVTDGLVHPTKSRTDGAGRVRETEDAETRVTANEYDANSNRVKFRDPNTTGMDFVFDERNREKQATDTATTPSVTKKEYDAASNIVKTTDALTKDTVCSFDARNRKVSCTDRISGVTSYEYDKNNNLTQITDADANAGNTGKNTIYNYDPRNLLAMEKFPDHVQNSVNDSRTYGYDGANRLILRLDQNSDTTTFAYDFSNRLLTRGYPDNQNDTFAYDAASRLTSAASARYNNVVVRNFAAGGEKAGRLKSETQTIGGNSYSVVYDYDAANRQTAVTYPSSAAVTRAFTNRNQLQQVWLNNVSVAQRTYDNGMRLSTTTYGNSLVENRAYRTDNLNDTIKIQGVTDFTYSWDADKSKTAEIDGIVPPVNSQTFGYDDENRLTSFSRQDGYSQSWNLSKVGDWSSFTDNGNQTTRTHNEVHELTAIGQTALSYDVKGNLMANSNGQSYQWDFENRMSQATIPANPNPVTATYAYDALGRRVSKTFNSITTIFINDGVREIAEYENGTLAREYVYGSYIDEPLMMKAGSTKTYYHSNNLYSVAALTDAAGIVVERYTYTPYGAVKILAPDGVTVRTTSAAANPWTFTGRRLDGETGLSYYRARLYSTELGRFISRDPLGYEGSLDNLYAYVRNKPTYLVDPRGTEESYPDCFCHCEQVDVSFDPGGASFALGLSVRTTPEDKVFGPNVLRKGTTAPHGGTLMTVNWQVSGPAEKCKFEQDESQASISVSIKPAAGDEWQNAQVTKGSNVQVSQEYGDLLGFFMPYVGTSYRIKTEGKIIFRCTSSDGTIVEKEYSIDGELVATRQGKNPPTIDSVSPGVCGAGCGPGIPGSAR